MQSPSVKKKLIVGVDFGTGKTCKTLFETTHYEHPSLTDHASTIGVSYAFWNQRRSSTPDIIRTFDIEHDHVFPTILAYLQDRSVTWGQVARTGKDPVFKWLKLFLYDQEHPILRETPNPALPDGVSSEQLVSDYLRQLYTEIQNLIVSPRRSAELGTDFWFSQPASWSADNQRVFAKAVRDAGFGSKEADNLFSLPKQKLLLYISYIRGDLKRSVKSLPNPTTLVSFPSTWPIS